MTVTIEIRGRNSERSSVEGYACSGLERRRGTVVGICRRSEEGGESYGADQGEWEFSTEDFQGFGPPYESYEDGVGRIRVMILLVLQAHCQQQLEQG